MKKLLVVLIFASLQLSAFAGSYVDKQLKEAKKNKERNSVEIHKVNYSLKNATVSMPVVDIKDPKLIKLSSFTPVDEKAYNEKLAKDEIVYKEKVLPELKRKTNSVNVEPAVIDFYNVYRISERIIRANNLDYVNWKIAIRKTEDINADASNVNLVRINTGLYDSLYDDEDALAFVIAHEMSHLILNHLQRQEELFVRLDRLTKYYSLQTDVDAILAGNTVASVQLGRILSQIKMMEFMADTEAFILLTKAGYSPYKALGALNFLSTMPSANVKYYWATHPMIKDRIKSAEENISYTNPDWIYEGNANVYNSNVLNCKKSSDRVSIVIEKSSVNKNFYQPEGIEERLTRIAYISYLKGDMENAVKYFEKLAKVDDNYVVNLYLSYANEYLYKKTTKEKYLKDAQKALKKAQTLNPNDTNVKNQESDINTL